MEAVEEVALGGDAGDRCDQERPGSVSVEPDRAAGPDPDCWLAIDTDDLVVGDFDSYLLVAVAAVQPKSVRIELEPPDIGDWLPFWQSTA